ncbi:hypothetical protein EB796_012017 [Bugula neritina]|uniref:Uncharacterized protein n=1 Tax=Bugula neritina TaxID=10212 RepID=A0A7J7JWD0_BUGNE|nr:hypothetical protein EB796_012017 [Bugula neritina]
MKLLVIIFLGIVALLQVVRGQYCPHIFSNIGLRKCENQSECDPEQLCCHHHLHTNNTYCVKSSPTKREAE